jgi:uncharacterized protein (TIGR02117 family)
MLVARPRSGLRPLGALLPWIGLVACAAGSAPLSPASGVGTPIHVVSNGWHTEIVMEAAALPAGAWPQREPFRGRRYLEVGWGDRDAYPADRLTPALALRAAFLSRGSALRVSGFDEPIAERFRAIEVVELRLSAAGLDALTGFIEASHSAGADGRPIRIDAAGSEAGSTAFYLGRDRFHVLNTCNSWTARALRAAGLPLWPALTQTAHQLMLQVRPLGRPVPAGSS